ncbi:MAG: nucleotidyltransferase family protein [Rhodospirillaceae bacterium]
MTEITVTVPVERVGMLRNYAQRISRNRPAQREEVLWALRHHAASLVQRYGVRRLALFGSVAHNRSRRESDVDLLVEFEPGRPTGMLEFVDLKGWLESVLGRPVDLVTPANLKPRIRERIMREAINVL